MRCKQEPLHTKQQKPAACTSSSLKEAGAEQPAGLCVWCSDLQQHGLHSLVPVHGLCRKFGQRLALPLPLDFDCRLLYCVSPRWEFDILNFKFSYPQRLWGWHAGMQCWSVRMVMSCKRNRIASNCHVLSSAKVLDMTYDESCSRNFDHGHAIIAMTYIKKSAAIELQTAYTDARHVCACMRHFNIETKLTRLSAQCRFVHNQLNMHTWSYNST